MHIIRELVLNIRPWIFNSQIPKLAPVFAEYERLKNNSGNTNQLNQASIDENEINRIDENELPSFAQGISQKYKLRLVNGDGVQLGKMYKESKGDFGGDFEGVMSYNPSISVVVVLSKNEKTGEEVFNEFKKFNANDVGYESFGLTVDGYKFPLDNQPTTEEKAFIKSFKINPQL